MFRKKVNNSAFGIPSNFLFNQSIVDVFVLQGILDLEDAQNLKKHFKTNRDIENFLLKNHLVTSETINKAYSIILKLPFIELKSVEIKDEALALVPQKFAIKFGVIPFDLDGRRLRIAITRPSDLPLGFSNAAKRLFQNKKIDIELYITGISDFKEAVKQYSSKSKKDLLIKQGSLPVVYLRNRKVPKSYLHKIPKDFIEKYRLVVFEENIYGEYLVACQEPDSPITKKIINYIEKENKVKLEPFATSAKDVDYILDVYDKDPSFQIEPMQEEGKEKIEEPVSDKNEKEAPLTVRDLAPVKITKFLDTIFKPKNPSITIDSISVTKDSFSKNEKKIIIDSNESLPVARLKENFNPEYIKKLPCEFIKKYRIVVFGENGLGQLQLATDKPNEEITKKAVDFIKNQHAVELFFASGKDIDYAISEYK